MPVEVIDHTDEFLSAFDRQLAAGLEAVGIQAESHAKDNIKGAGRVNTGALQNSIEHRVVMGEKAAYIGTNLNYAPYHELGSGIYAEGGPGRKGWWVYVPGSGGGGKNTGKVYSEEKARQIVAIMRSQGIDAHMTQGIKPIHFLKKAASQHSSEYRGIIEKYLKK